MKYVFVILATVSILLQTFSKAIIFVNFELNRTYIAKNLCVQRAKKDNCCKGSCHLRKTLEEDDKRQEGPGSELKNLKDILIYCQANYFFDFNRKALPSPKFKAPSDPLTISVSFSIFHPPQGLI